MNVDRGSIDRILALDDKTLRELAQSIAQASGAQGKRAQKLVNDVGFLREKPRKPLAAGVLDSLRELKLDDLLIIAIGILLLLDSGSDNDMIVLLIAAMLLF